MKDIVTIIIPIYNVEDYLEKCLTSILNQTYKYIEIIAINDGSTDSSNTILQKYANIDKRVKVIDRENKGRQYSRKEGIEKAKGNYIMFIDSDDWIETTMVEKMINTAVKYDADIVKSSFVIENMENGVKNNNIILFDTIKEIKKQNFKEIIYLNMINTYQYNQMWGQLIRKDLIKKETMENGIDLGEDLLFNIELYSNIDNIVYMPEFFYHYRINVKNKKKKSINKIKKDMDDIYIVYKKLLDCLVVWNMNTEENKENIKNEIIKRIIELTNSNIKNDINIKIILNTLKYSREKFIDLYPNRIQKKILPKLYINKRYFVFIIILKLKKYLKVILNKKR